MQAQVVWQWIRKVWSRFTSSPAETGVQGFFGVARGLPPILQFVLMLAVLEVAIVGFLAFDRALNAEANSVLIGLGISFLILALMAIIAFAITERVTTHPDPRPDAHHDDPHAQAVLQYIANNGPVTREDMHRALDLPMDKLEAVCQRLLAEGLAQQTQGLFVAFPNQAEQPKRHNT